MKVFEFDVKYLFIFGGEIWSGVCENVINDIFILEIEKMWWYKVVVFRDVFKFVGYFMVGIVVKIFVFGGGVGNKY